ncbi:hypothetical protein [Jeongeupia sp. USM3]|uniref:hypothetical protein n=1 Tax=Jeongeupia sp. USM3 TaxID=1906741 RepID=UPI0011AB77D1|nr:hypothetical protein [Jeongeupia sp. USM3]
MSALKQAREALERIATYPADSEETAALVLARIANDALAAIAQHEQVPGEPVAWVVYWGIGEMRKYSVHFEKATADEVASQIKSHTEVRPLYPGPQPDLLRRVAEAVRREAIDECISVGKGLKDKSGDRAVGGMSAAVDCSQRLRSIDVDAIIASVTGSAT